MSIFEISAVLIGLTTLFGWINQKFLHLPHTIGLVFIALVASLAVILTDILLPGLSITGKLSEGMRKIDFGDTLLKGMLSFLLFAGAANIDFAAFKDRLATISTMAFFGTIISTFTVGLLTWLGLDLLEFDTPFIWCLLFGALISPTDPVAVLGLFKSVKVPAPLEAKMAGESLLNDGIGVVIFTVVLAIALGQENGGDSIGIGFVVEVFLREALGGALLGLFAGWVCFHAIRSTEESSLQVLMTLSLVMCTYALAIRLEMSGPLAMVIAGLFVGSNSDGAMNEENRNYMKMFWTLIDEILNSVLFLLIGLEVLIVYQRLDHLSFALLAIPVCLFARWLSVFLPITFLSRWTTFTPGTIPILTWGGLRGGIAVALALSLPEDEHKAIILTVTYAVVLFSIIVQGLTVKPLVKLLIKNQS